MVWDKPRILDELRRLHRRGSDLSYNSLAKKSQSLVSAAAYHFSSYRKAVEAAGIDYAVVVRRPRWDRPEVRTALRQAQRAGESLADSAIRRNNPALYGAAVRLFGTFTAARDAAKVAWKRGPRN